MNVTERFCYRIEPEAGVAVDENGNAVEAYLEAKMERENPMAAEERTEATERFREAIANMLKIPQELIIPISEEEYDANVLEEGESDGSSC